MQHKTPFCLINVIVWNFRILCTDPHGHARDLAPSRCRCHMIRDHVMQEVTNGGNSVAIVFQSYNKCVKVLKCMIYGWSA